MDAVAKALGMDRKTFGRRLHAIKGEAKGDVMVNREDGSVHDKATGDWMGNIFDED
ncbi:hypothetical protein [Roseospirillum parvum]|uniref:hypothetical protein n=1 Tax=Roseospirillum parvum TaxID=83401 RepID=UPI0015A39642|nr:hypothetical protein [Roseospirillum parvum]